MTKKKQPAVFLKGKRIFLRTIEEADLERCRRWVNDPDIRQFITRSLPLDGLAEQDWHASRDRGRVPHHITLAIVLVRGHRHIGNIGLHEIDWVNRSACTGMIIGEKRYWSEGYGYEAKELLLEYVFNELGLHRIRSEVFVTNPRSLACLKKSGYQVEGRDREAYWCDGKWVDKIRAGLLETEWRTTRKKKGKRGS